MEANKIKVLDHGFVQLRNLAGPTRRALQDPLPNGEPHDVANILPGGLEWRPFDADDTDPANAARMSFDGMDQDRDYGTEMKLNRYLLKNRHMTPFEMVVVWLEMKLPIFVARQFVRHGTARLNEVSARYVQLPSEWYTPELASVLIQSKDKKQGGIPVDLIDPEQYAIAQGFVTRLDDDCHNSYVHYQRSISDGIAMEQARLHLHVNHYTHWLWKQDLRNMFGFLLLRDHGHAQQEAQAYAKAITQLLDPHIPGLMQLYRDIVRGEGL